jgi:hypothetical protein
MDASLAATAATAGYTPALWLASLLALAAAVVAYVVMGGASGHRTAHVRRPTRGHVRRAAARFLFHAADASSVDVSAGEVTLADGVARAARAVAVVERGAHLSDGRALRVRIGEEAAAGGVERVLNFPSRRAAEAFQDALLHAQRRAAAPRPRAVTLSLNTWNVGNAEPPQDLAPWMDATRHADVIAFGTQECSYSVSAGTGPSRATSAGAAAADKALDGGGLSAPTLVEASVASTMDMSSTDLLVGDPTLSSANNLSGKEHWHAVVKAHFPKSEYVSVAEIASWDRCLSVFVKRELAEAVSHVRSDTAFVGLGGVAGNKGAVAVRFSIFDTDFVIVNSHLAAHQGHAARRNQDYSSIASSLRGLRDGPSVDVLTSTVHHVFWMGDLNYRIDLDVRRPTRRPRGRAAATPRPPLTSRRHFSPAPHVPARARPPRSAATCWPRWRGRTTARSSRRTSCAGRWRPAKRLLALTRRPSRSRRRTGTSAATAGTRPPRCASRPTATASSSARSRASPPPSRRTRLSTRS